QPGAAAILYLQGAGHERGVARGSALITASRRRERLSRVGSAEWDQIHLGRTNEIILGQSTDGVCGEAYAAIVVADLEVRMMVLDVRDVRERVDEAHGAVEVAEPELAPDRASVIAQLPAAGNLREQSLRLARGERRNAALAGLALARREVSHRLTARRA